MRSIVIFMILALMMAGCSRNFESEDLDIHLPDGPPIPVSLKIVHLQDALELSWQVTDTVEDISFVVYYSDSLEGDYILWDTTNSFSSVITSLSSGQTYYFKVSSILPNGLEGSRSKAISVQVGVLSMAINDGDKYTNSRTVTVSFVVPTEATLFQVSDNATFAGAHWENYTQSRVFTLSPGDGVKHVYARFRFSDGSESDSVSAVSDSIILDTEALISSVSFFPSTTVLAEDSTVAFFVVTDELEGEAEVSFPGVSSWKLIYDDTLSDTSVNRCVYSRSYTIPANLEVIDGVVTGNFTDAAGNAAPDVSATTLLNISNPPTAVTLAATAVSSASIRLNWAEAVDEDFAAYHIYRGLSSLVSNTSPPIEIITSKSTLMYIDSDLDDGTKYFYRIYVYDITGLFAASEVESATTLENQAPNPVTLAARVEGSDLILSWSANEDEDFESYRIYRTTDTTAPLDQASLLGIINDQSETSFTDNPPSGSGDNYGVAVYDKQGKSAMSNWVVP